MTPNTRGAVFALIGFALYSAHDVVVKYLGSTYSTYQIIFFSVLLSFPFVIVMHMRERNHENLIPKHPWWTALRTVSTTLTAFCAFYAFTELPLAQTYSLLFGMPLVITILSIPILGERVGFHRWAAVILGLIGVMVILRPGQSSLGLGHLAALVAAFGAGFSSVIVRKIGRDERNIVLMLFPMFANLVIMGVLMPYDYVPIELPDLAAIALMAVLATLASLSIILAYKIGEAAVVAPMHYSQMLWAIIYGYLFFNELPDRYTLVGSSIIIASGLYVVFRESKTKTSNNTPVLRTRSRADTGILPRISATFNPNKTNG